MNKYIAKIVNKYSIDEIRNMDELFDAQVRDKSNPRTLYANSNPVICIMVAAACFMQGEKAPQWAIRSRLFDTRENQVIIQLAHEGDFVTALFEANETVLREFLEPLNVPMLTNKIINIAVNGKK